MPVLTVEFEAGSSMANFVYDFGSQLMDFGQPLTNSNSGNLTSVTRLFSSNHRPTLASTLQRDLVLELESSQREAYLTPTLREHEIENLLIALRQFEEASQTAAVDQWLADNQVDLAFEPRFLR